MKTGAIIFCIIQAVLLQVACSNIIQTTIPYVSSGPVIVQPSVANTLADTLSLLTVSSLLYETLPMKPNVVTTVPLPPAGLGFIPSVDGCGRLRNYGYNVL